MADPTIAELLEQSRAAHAEYRANVPRMVAGGAGSAVAIEGDVVKAAAALERAATLRRQAIDLDGEFLDDAWTVDSQLTGGPHTLMTWYAEHLGRTDDAVAVAAQRIADGVPSPAVAAKRAGLVEEPAPVVVPVDPAPKPADPGPVSISGGVVGFPVDGGG